MLSLELVSEIQAGASVVTPFQPYWEILIDFSLTGFLLTVLLGLAGVTLTGTSEIVCLPILNGSYSTDLNINLFVNSRCSRKFGGSFLLYYPYLALVAYLVLLFAHLMSVKLPSTSSFISLMFHLFADFKNLRNLSSYFGAAVVTSPEEQRSNNESRKGGKLYKILKAEVKENVIALVERLMSALNSSSGFFVAYVAKSVILFIGSALIILGNIFTLVIFDWSLVFDCDLTMFVPITYEKTSCTIPAAPFLYGLMIIGSVCAFFILVFAGRALFWLIRIRNYQEDYLNSWGKGEHILINHPGFNDFCFCLMLMRHNGTDGDDVYKTVNSSLKIYRSLKVGQYFENDQLLGTTIASDLQFERDNYICDFMLKEMGMVSNETEEANGLIATLANVCRILGLQDMIEEGNKRVRKIIFDELLSHPTLYKDIIESGSANLPSFREYAKSVMDGSFVSGEVSECLYIFMAFTTCTSVRLVLLRPNSSSLVFTPVKDSGDELEIVFLKHVPPSDYVTVTFLDEASDEQLSNRNNFLPGEHYPETLHRSALQSWESTGYKNFLRTLTALLPKYLTGTEDMLDRVDGTSDRDNQPIKAHLAYLQELGLGESQNEQEDTG